MPWHAILDQNDDLRSIASEAPNPGDLPQGWEIVNVGADKPEGLRWNKTTKSFEPAPADPDKQAADTIVNTAAVRTKLRNVAQGLDTFTAQERDRVLAYVALRLLG